MILTLGGRDGQKATLRSQLRGAVSALEKSRKALSDFTPVWKAFDREYSTQIRTAFRSAAWPSLAPGTIAQRRRRGGWYSQPSAVRRIGQWTGRMYRGLLGEAPLGRKVLTSTFYLREYSDHETYGGKSVGVRVESFLFGRGPAGRGGPQPARPAWRAGWRERRAREIFQDHVDRRVLAPLRGIGA